MFIDNKNKILHKNIMRMCVCVCERRACMHMVQVHNHTISWLARHVNQLSWPNHENSEGKIFICILISRTLNWPHHTSLVQKILRSTRETASCPTSNTNVNAEQMVFNFVTVFTTLIISVTAKQKYKKDRDPMNCTYTHTRPCPQNLNVSGHLCDVGQWNVHTSKIYTYL